MSESKNSIKLSPESFEKVLNGKKTATTRKGLKMYTLGGGLLYNPNSPEECINIMIVKIVATTWKHVRCCNLNLHKYEAYDYSFELDNALESFYGKMHLDQVMTTIYFKVI